LRGYRSGYHLWVSIALFSLMGWLIGRVERVVLGFLRLKLWL
jgi:hypothetical protein